MSGDRTTTSGNGTGRAEAFSELALIPVLLDRAVYMQFEAIAEGTGLLVAVQPWQTVIRDTGISRQFAELKPWDAFVVDGTMCRKLAEPCKPRHFQREHLEVITKAEQVRKDQEASRLPVEG